MPNPNQRFNTGGGTNAINGNSLQDQLNGLLNESAVEATEVQPATAGQTNEFDVQPEGEKKTVRKSIAYTEPTKAAIGAMKSSLKTQQSAVSESQRKAQRKLAAATTIVGYCASYNEKIDFVRRVEKQKHNGEPTGVATFTYSLVMKKPKKPDRVIVRYPSDLYQIVKNAQKGSVMSEEITKASEQVNGNPEDSYSVIILGCSKNSHELADFIHTALGQEYIKEAEEIFEPYYKAKRGEESLVPVVETYSSATRATADTNGHPGIKATYAIAPVKTATVNTGTASLINLTGEGASRLVLTYKHTGRPTWSTPNNTIYDKIAVTEAGGVKTGDDIHSYSRAYFGRYYEDFATPKQPKDIREFKPADTNKITVAGNDAESFTASVFEDASFWENASVEHWYDVESVDGKIRRKVLTGANIRLIVREEKMTKNGGRSYSNVLKAIGEDGYSWEDAVPAKVKAALNGAVLDYETYKESASKNASRGSGSSKTKSTVVLDAANITFEELSRMMNSAFVGNNSIV